MFGTAYFDRTGHPITQQRWASLASDEGYRLVRHNWVRAREVEVVTLWNGWDPDPAAPIKNVHRIFYVSRLMWDRGRLAVHDHRLHVTERAALHAHETFVRDLSVLLGETAGP